MKLVDVLKAPDLTREGVALLRARWLPLVETASPAKLESSLMLADARLEKLAAGDVAGAAQAQTALELLLENCEIALKYRREDFAGELALLLLEVAAGAVIP